MVSPQVVVLTLHRVGMVILLLGSLMLVILPYVFNREDDLSFATKSSVILHRACWLGLFLLLVTGFIQLDYGIPTLFPLKAVFIVITLMLFLRSLPYQPDTRLVTSRYLKFGYLRLAAVIITGTVGLML